jgi:hypothetical protein
MEHEKHINFRRDTGRYGSIDYRVGYYISDKRGGFNGSTQHHLEVYLQGVQQLKVCRER